MSFAACNAEIRRALDIHARSRAMNLNRLMVLWELEAQLEEWNLHGVVDLPGSLRPWAVRADLNAAEWGLLNSRRTVQGALDILFDRLLPQVGDGARTCRHDGKPVQVIDEGLGVSGEFCDDHCQREYRIRRRHGTRHNVRAEARSAQPA